MAQGTVKDFDFHARTGTLLMDDRTEVAIEPASIPPGSEIRTLRIGQRVGFDLDPDDPDAGPAPGEGSGHKVARNLRVVTFGL
jgi:cold shock CspA family protein